MERERKKDLEIGEIDILKWQILSASNFKGTSLCEQKQKERKKMCTFIFL